MLYDVGVMGAAYTGAAHARAKAPRRIALRIAHLLEGSLDPSAPRADGEPRATMRPFRRASSSQETLYLVHDGVHPRHGERERLIRRHVHARFTQQIDRVLRAAAREKRQIAIARRGVAAQ